MREMVLNHASVLAPGSNRESIIRWLEDLAGGMAMLVDNRVVQRSLRMAHAYSDTPCLPDYSLFDATNDIRERGFRDEYVFLLRLAAKAPLLAEVSEAVRDRFRSCEGRMLAAPDGDPLVFCAISDGVLVGFPSTPEWDRDRVTVCFDELLPDATIEPTSEEIDQLTRAAHAGPICARYRDRFRVGSDPVSLWENRAAAFPNLTFGPDVEGNLKDNANVLPTIVGKLVELDRSAGEWRETGARTPHWRTRVSPESVESMKNRKFREARRFRTSHGTHQLFEWHARFGDHGRIHLRFDPESREVEIGYIGWHLPG